MYDEILIPTDGSEAAAAAVDHAVSHGERYDARLHVLYVVDADTYATVEGLDAYTAPEPGAGMVVEALEEQGEEVTEELAATMEESGVDVVSAVERGSPHETILDYAEREEVDLVVMGTHGRSGLDRFIVGSVTERVVRHSEAPVLTVRQEADEA